MEVLVAEEGGAFGCALMAGVGVGHWKNLDEACAQAIEVAQRIEPDATDVAAYKPGYARVEKAVSGAAQPCETKRSRLRQPALRSPRR